MDDDSVRSLYGQFYVDPASLRLRIETLLETRPHCTLGEVLDRYPVQKGLAEVITYLTIAAADARHQIDPAAQETINLPALRDEQPRLLSLPRVVFRSVYAS
jgi:hypothetical protein